MEEPAEENSIVQKQIELEINEDMHDLIQVDDLLDKSDSKLLDFERQMFLDLIYNDALVICGK